MFKLFKNHTNEEVAKLPYQTDIHSHLLPGVDDGARTVERSIELISYLQKWGVEKIITTSHIAQETFENNENTLNEAYRLLLSEIGKQDTKIDISYSAEYRLDDNFIALMEKNILIPFSDNYILIENSFLQPYWDLRGIIFRLQVGGYSPILAHPERYVYYHNNLEIFDELHKTGCMFQLNILSFSGHYGKSVKEVSLHLLKKGYVDYLGTDLHHMAHVEAIDTFLKSKEYAKLYPQFDLKNNSL